MENYLQKKIEGNLDFDRTPITKMFSKKHSITFRGFLPIQMVYDDPNFTQIMDMTRACVDNFILKHRDDFMMEFELKYSMDGTVSVNMFTLEKEEEKHQ